jgi:hypothetical protein
MSIDLTEALRQALEKSPDQSLRLRYPHTNFEYVVIRADVYDQPGKLVGLDPKDTHPLLDETFREGWDDPKMAEYDDYESRMKQK